MLVLAASGVGHAVVTGVESGIGRVDAFKGMSDRPGGGDGLNFLVVGTDGRDKLTPAEKQKYHLGGAPCHCTDTLMLVHLSADRDRASVVSLPRDSYAEVPAHTDAVTGGQRAKHAIKLNAAYAEGGPSLTVRTVEHMTGVHIDHYLEVDFTSFMRSVDAVGGVEICTVRPLRDSYTGLDLPVGKSRLNGGQALQYVRSRHIDGSADLGRMQRQQRFLAALIHKITSSGVLMNPIRFRDVADTMLKSVRADSGFGPMTWSISGRPCVASPPRPRSSPPSPWAMWPSRCRGSARPCGGIRCRHRSSSRRSARTSRSRRTRTARGRGRRSWTYRRDRSRCRSATAASGPARPPR